MKIRYPGRVLGYAIVTGKDGKPKLAAIYALTGRSLGRGKTRNRNLVTHNGGWSFEAEFAIDTNGLVQNPQLYEYVAMQLHDVFSYLSNGDHMEKLVAGDGYSIGTDLYGQTYEKDPENTPRIAGMAVPKWTLPDLPEPASVPFMQFAVLKKAADSDQNVVLTAMYSDLTVGTGRFVHTYDLDDPDQPGILQPFNRSEPHLIEIGGKQVDGDDAKSVAFDVWQMLAPPTGEDDFRISVAVQLYGIGKDFNDNDPPETWHYNRYSTEDPGEGVNDRLIENKPFKLD